jgi:hypothetical protein
VRQTALSSYSVEYQLNAYLERAEERIAVLSALHESIQDCFYENGVEILTPHYEGPHERPRCRSGRDGTDRTWVARRPTALLMTVRSSAWPTGRSSA